MTFAHAFLLVTGVFFLVVFALPILFMPTTWARWFRWHDADNAAPLTLYFGRCLGAAATAITCVALSYAGSPTHQALLLDLIALAAFLLTGVHAWGALSHAQPWTEDAEVLLYGAATVVALWIRYSL